MPKFTVIYSRNYSGQVEVIAPNSEQASDLVYARVLEADIDRGAWPDEISIIDVTEVTEHESKT